MIDQIKMSVPLLVQENEQAKVRLSCKNFWQYLFYACSVCANSMNSESKAVHALKLSAQLTSELDSELSASCIS
jgi:hypothetical protein